MVGGEEGEQLQGRPNMTSNEEADDVQQ